MTLPTMIVAAALIASVFVPYDATYVNTVHSHETKVVNVQMLAGPSSVDVWATDNEVISCRVLDPQTYQVLSKDDNVKRCLYNADGKVAEIGYIAIVNDGDKAIETRIWVRSTKK